MTYLRIWDEQFQFLHSATGDDAELVTAAEQFMAERTEPWLHYTLDTTPGGSFRTRMGGQLIRTEDGIHWRDNRSLLRHMLSEQHVELPADHWSLPHIKPGDRFALDLGDGTLYTDTIESVSMKSPERISRPRTPFWRRVVRALTPRRFRKVELWTPPGGGLGTVVVTVGEPDRLSQARQTIARANELYGAVYGDDWKPMVIGQDFSVGERSKWSDVVHEMAQSEPDTDDQQ